MPREEPGFTAGSRSGRWSGRFDGVRCMAPFVVRLAEALGRYGRFADDVRIVDVAIALEGMYELPKR